MVQVGSISGSSGAYSLRGGHDQTKHILLTVCVCLGVAACAGSLVWIQQHPPPTFDAVTSYTASGTPCPSAQTLASRTPPFQTVKTYDTPKRIYPENPFRLTDFPVAGVNLAKYGVNQTVLVDPYAKPFALFEDFDISDMIKGDETWWDLLSYRRELQRPSLSFYGDKVAQKRWMRAMNIPTPQNFVLKYARELTGDGSSEDEKEIISSLIPRRTNYVAKPTHRSASSGVWVVKYDQQSGKSVVGYGGEKLEGEYKHSEVVKRLLKDLHRRANSDESWALQHVKPGLMMEERFTDMEEDEKAATEFKVFLIWGRIWIVNWKQGLYRHGLVHRNGTLVNCADKHHETLPGWIDWNRIVKLAEGLAANKDLFRVDIFAGLPAASTKDSAVQYVVSETAFHPTTTFRDKEIFDEGARLWISGYKMGNYKITPNHEIPAAYKESHMLTEEDAERIEAQRQLASFSSSVVLRRSLRKKRHQQAS